MKIQLIDIAPYIQGLVENSRDVFWIRSADYSQQVYVSQSYEEVWGRTCSSLYQCPERWADDLVPEDWVRLQEDIAKRNPDVLAGDRFFQFYRIVRPNGEVRWIEDESFAIFDVGGKHIGFAGIASDVTQNKMQTKKLAELGEREAASRAKSNFIANMSHDIRTPITGMVGMVQDLHNTVHELRGSLEQKPVRSNDEWLALMHGLLNHVESDSDIFKSSVDQLLQLCNEILEVTRLERGAVTDQPPESFDIHELVRHNISLLQSVAVNKKLILRADIEAGVPQYVHGLKGYLDRSLLNLVSNALKFTHEGSVVIKLSLVNHDAVVCKPGDKVTLQICIEDTGIGIPEDKFEAIFEHFSRLTSSHEGVYKGSGLGLYTVKHYVETMGGHIGVTSQLGRGSCFAVTLPFVVSDHVDAQLLSESADVPAVRAVTSSIPDRSYIKASAAVDSSSSCHVLVVEDNKMAAFGVKVALTPFNCVVDFAENGATAIEKAKNNAYDLILMDIGLPDMNGLEVTKAIRALSDVGRSGVPIVALTGHFDDAEARQQCLAVGMQEVLRKPAEALALEGVFQHFVRKTRECSSSGV